MKKRSTLNIVTLLIVSILFAPVCKVLAKEAISLKTMPPSVIQTFPVAGDVEVDYSIKEIRVTFSKEMMTKNMWSWCMESKESFPHITGKIHYLKDKKTCVAPVKLQPGKTYVIWFNTAKYNAFRDIDGQAAVPYLLVFKTKD